MSVTSAAADLTVDQWQSKFFVEYVRNNRFSRYMGTNENSVIQLIMDLSKKRGDDIWVALVTELSNTGIVGDNTLEGNEESLTSLGDKININQLRNAVAIGTMERKKSAIDLLMAAEKMLKLWAMARLRDDIVARMLCPNVDGLTTYASSNETQKDAWLAANGQGVASNRVLFGAAKSNNAGDDHSVALAEVDSSSDTLVAGLVSLAKRMARDSDPAIRPVRVGEDEEWYVLFANKWAFRDLKADLSGEHQNAGVRGKANPLWNDGDLMYDGCIIREVPEIGVLSGVGDTSIDVAPNFLCGAQAIGVAWGQKTKAIKDTRDYGNIRGVGVAEIRGVQKLIFNDIQHGMLTLYTSGVADT